MPSRAYHVELTGPQIDALFNALSLFEAEHEDDPGKTRELAALDTVAMKLRRALAFTPTRKDDDR